MGFLYRFGFSRNHGYFHFSKSDRFSTWCAFACLMASSLQSGSPQPSSVASPTISPLPASISPMRPLMFVLLLLISQTFPLSKIRSMWGFLIISARFIIIICKLYICSLHRHLVRKYGIQVVFWVLASRQWRIRKPLKIRLGKSRSGVLCSLSSGVLGCSCVLSFRLLFSVSCSVLFLRLAIRLRVQIRRCRSVGRRLCRIRGT